MNGLGGRLTGYLWLVSIIFLIVFVFGYLYYLQTERKEHYFDQLYFRQLDEVSRAFQNNLQRLKFFTRVQNRIAPDWEKREQALEKGIQDQDAAISGFEGQLDELIVSIVDAESEMQAEETQTSLESDADYERFLSTQNELEYYSPLTRTEMEGLMADETVDLFATMFGSGEILDKYKQRFLCSSQTPTEQQSQSASIKKDYCDILGVLEEALAKIASFGQLAYSDVSEFDTSEIDKVLARLKETEGLGKKAANNPDNYESKLDEQYEFLMFLEELKSAREQLPEQAQLKSAPANISGKPMVDHYAIGVYLENKAMVEGYDDYFKTEALKTALSGFYAEEECGDPCEPWPTEDLYEAIQAEWEAHEPQAATLLINFAMSQFIFGMDEELRTLAGDVEKYKAALVSLKVQKKGIEESQQAAAESQPYWDNLDQLNEKLYEAHARRNQLENLLTNLQEEQKDYFADLGHASKAGERHYLKLGYVSKETLIKEEGREQGFEEKLRRDTFYIEPVNTLGGRSQNRLQVSSYLNDGHVFRALLNKLLPANVGQFDTLLVASDDGSVLLERVAHHSTDNHEFLNIGDILARAIEEEKMAHASPKKGADKVKDKDKPAKPEKTEEQNDRLTHSTYVNQAIGGINYRLYIYPHQLHGMDLNINGEHSERPTLYFIGVKPQSQMSAAKLKIAPSWSMVLFAVVLAILLAIVFLKIQLAHFDASFSRSDGVTAAFALVLLAAITTAGITTLGVSDRLFKELKQDARFAIQSLQSRFGNEVILALSRVEYLLQQQEVRDALTREGSKGSRDHLVRVSLGDTQATLVSKSGEGHLLLKENRPDYQPGWFLSPLDNLFILNRDGIRNGEIIRGTKSLISSSANTNLSGREYFQRARDGDVWNFRMTGRSPAFSNCGSAGAYPVFIQRISNIVDGALTTQFSMPVRHQVELRDAIKDRACYYDLELASEEDATALEVVSFGSSILTFKSPVLPPGMQFTVIDNKTGSVLYHSENDRSLVENFFQETENNVNLQAHIRASTNVREKAQDAGEQIQEFSGLYRGKETLFFADKLHKDIPWTIIIYKHAGDLQSIIALYFCISLLVAVALILAIMALVYVLGLPQRESTGFGPRPRNTTRIFSWLRHWCWWFHLCITAWPR